MRFLIWVAFFGVVVSGDFALFHRCSFGHYVMAS